MGCRRLRVAAPVVSTWCSMEWILFKTGFYHYAFNFKSENFATRVDPSVMRLRSCSKKLILCGFYAYASFFGRDSMTYHHGFRAHYCIFLLAQPYAHPR